MENLNLDALFFAFQVTALSGCGILMISLMGMLIVNLLK